MKTRSLTEGAILGALTVLLTLLGEYLGLPAVIVPVPLILMVYRQGFRWGVITAFVAALITGLAAGHVFAGLSIIIWGFVGVALGMALRERFSFVKLMATGVFANLVVIGLNALLYALIIGGNQYRELMNVLLESIEQAMATARGLGVPEEALGNYQMMQQLVPFIFQNALPAILFLSSLGMSFVHLAVVRLVLKRMGDVVPWAKPFRQWRLPGYCAIFLVFGWVVTQLALFFELPRWLEFVGVNVFYITSAAYLVTGLSLAWYYFNQRKTPTFLRILFVFLLYAIPLALIALILLTIVDGFVDLRRLLDAKAEVVRAEDQDLDAVAEAERDHAED